MVQDPLRVACWRFEHISPLIDSRLTASERCRMMEEMAKIPVLWPSGREEPIALSTLYHWLKLYMKDKRIESLMSQPYTTRIMAAPAIRPEWAQYALALLEEESARSLFILGLRIQDHFHLQEPPSRSSLHRALKKEPRYWKVQKRAHGESRLRVRFQAANPHDIWHGDAKAYFWVQFVDGTRVKVRILSILDDATRYILRALVVRSESTAAAVAAFRQSASRYGLPVKFYVDRGSPYDSEAFRKGLAILGVHRINTKSRNPSAHGKIEAYHRVLGKWMIKELLHQPVLDFQHLQELVDAVIQEVYNKHLHRGLKKSPEEAFRDSISKRLVSLERLREAFMIERVLKPHKKTGTIDVKGDPFKVPKQYLSGSKVKIAIDPESPEIPYLVVRPGVFEPLKPAIQKAGKLEEGHSESKDRIEPAGSLTPLLEKYRGRTLPQARAGFGLPEIYEIFSESLRREVPAAESEASIILDWLGRSGPFDPEAFRFALSKIGHRLGNSRPLAQIIQALDREIGRNLRKDK